MEDSIKPLILLRMAVGLLGQKHQHNWWDCDFLDQSGLTALDYNFQRAPLLAGFTATCLAAKRLHDDRIGRTGVTHLFRLEPGLEMHVQKTVRRGGDALLAGLPRDAEKLMAELHRLGQEEIDTPEGPVQVGVLDDANTAEGIAQLARHYHAGFRLRAKVFPYFASRKA